ncbi:MAG: tetratricopeptide repeat-containing sensor histidine kinase [Saprospiraceae bacterium]|nr:tetratricopeptide repeat-containing sensor histidine kinase [Saprospiraceae bacterium]
MRAIIHATLLGGVFLVCTSQSFAYTEGKIDSLKALLEQNKEPDSLRWTFLHGLSRDYAVISPDSSIFFGEAAIQLAERLRNDELLFKSYNVIGVGYIRKQAENQALQYFLKALELAKSHKENAWKKLQAQAFINVAGVFWSQNDIKSAVPYAHQARYILEKLNEPNILADNYHSLGLMYEVTSTLDSAIFYLGKSLKIYRQIPIPMQEGRVLSVIGDIYLKQGFFERAISHYQLALDIAKQESDIANTIGSIIDIVEAKIKLNLYKEVINTTHEALSLAQSESFDNYRAIAYRYLSDAYFQERQLDSAYYYLMEHYELDKKLNTAEKSRQINELNIAYQTKETALENEVLQQKNQSIKIRERYILIASLFLIMGIAVIGFSTYRLQKKNKVILQQNEKVNALLEEKSQLITLITHDIQTPLSVIQFTVAALMHENQNNKIELDLQSIELAARQIGYLSTRISDLQKFGEHDFSIEIEPINIDTIIKEAGIPYIQWAKKKNVIVEENSTEWGLKVMADPFFLSKAFGNILGNAIKFSEPGKKVKIEVSTLDGFCLIAVQDEGPGISSEEQGKLFHKYQQLSAKPTFGEPSTGSGLYLSKRYIDAMGGKILVDSELGVGSTFTIKVPLAAKA